tara:strand:+ start:2894 stop:5209 length:2316 start_codon:yes stop_codon:yes gene_type:complete
MSVFRENTQLTEQKEITEQKETFAKKTAKIPYRGKHPALNSTNNSTADIDVGLVYADHTVDSFVSAEHSFREIADSKKNYKQMFKKAYVQEFGMDNFLENVAHNDLMKYFQTIQNHGGGSSFYYAIVNFIDSTKSLHDTFWKNKEYLKLLEEDLKLLKTNKYSQGDLRQRRDAYPHRHGTIIKTLEFFKMHWIRHLVYNEVKRDSRTTEKLKAMLLKGVIWTLSDLFVDEVYMGADRKDEWSLGNVGKECRTIDGMEILAAARIIKHDIIIRYSRVVQKSPRKNRVGFRYFEIKPDNMQLKSACILKVNGGQYANLVAIKEYTGHIQKESFHRQKNKSMTEIYITQNSSIMEDLLMHEHNLSEHRRKKKSQQGRRKKHRRPELRERQQQHHVREDTVERLGLYAKVIKGENSWWKVGDLKINRVTRDLLQKYQVEVQGGRSKSNSFFVYFKGEQAEIIVYNNPRWQSDLQNFVKRIAGSLSRSQVSLVDTVTTHRSRHKMVRVPTGTTPRSRTKSPSRSHTMSHTMSPSRSPSRSHTMSRTMSRHQTSTVASRRLSRRRSSHHSCKHSKKSGEDYSKLLSAVQQHYERYQAQWIEKLPPDLKKKLFKYVQSKQQQLEEAGFYRQYYSNTGETLKTIFPGWRLQPLLLVQVLKSIHSPVIHPKPDSKVVKVDKAYIAKEIMLLIGTNGACCFLNDSNNKGLKKQLLNFMENIITSNWRFFRNPWLFNLANIRQITTGLDLDVGIGLVLLNWGYSHVDCESIYDSQSIHYQNI